MARAYNSALNLSGRSFTLSAWINPRANTAWQMIVNKPAHTSHSYPYFDWSMHRQTSSGRIAAFLGCDGSQRTSNASAPMNTWTHVAITYDGNALRHYVNGALDRTTVITCSVTNTSSQPIRIGANASSAEVMNGSIDDVRIYNRVLSAAEINADMSTPLGGSGGAAPPPDASAPTVSMSTPSNGATASGTVTVSADATDNIGVVGVQFRLDGTNLGAEEQSAPYAISWATTAANNGTHTLVAVARDAAGNVSTSSPVSIMVSNSTGTPTIGATLSATPSSGAAPVNGVDLTAAVSGSATGTIVYTFYCNRSDAATSVTSPWDRQVSTSQTTLGVADVCNFQSAGTYVAKVIAQRGGYAAEARTSITVSTPTPVQVQLSGSPTSVASGGTSNLTWSSVNASACTASGAWSGAKPTSGSASTAALFAANNTFTLTCSGGSGSASTSTTVRVDGATAVTGLVFPSNGDSPADAFVAFQFLNPQNNGLPIWGPSNQGATYIWKYRPRQQTGYYATLWWSHNGPFDATVYYGAHPYPSPPGVGSTSHNWEIAGMAFGSDWIWTRNGNPKPVVKDVWYTQALRIVRNPDGTKTARFYIALPSLAAGDIIEYTAAASYGNTMPSAPALTFGDSPWYAQYQHERLSGVLRGIKIFNKALSESDVLAEANSDSLVTSDGQANVWYMNVNPTPSDISDKSGRGHNPVWGSSTRPLLWNGP